MNDIEVLEERIKSIKEYDTYRYDWAETDIQLVENLLKERQSDKEIIKELEEENIKLKEYIFTAPNLDEMTAIKYMKIQEEGYISGRAEEQQKARELIHKHYIPKSLIKEKIEELKEVMITVEKENPQTYALIDLWRNAKAGIEILEELLKGE